ncbi:hypothetical protein MHYP_G00315900 [Metynnis hypsauchen]
MGQLQGHQPETTIHQRFAPLILVFFPQALSFLLSQSQKLPFSASSARAFVAFLSLPPLSPTSLRRRVVDKPMKPRHPTSTGKK